MPMQIPLSAGAANADTSFEINIDDVIYVMRLQYKALTKTWSLSIYRNGEPVALGIRLVKGCDLLSAYLDLNFGRLVVLGEEPTLSNLGISSFLVWVGPDEAL